MCPTRSRRSGRKNTVSTSLFVYHSWLLINTDEYVIHLSSFGLRWVEWEKGLGKTTSISTTCRLSSVKSGTVSPLESSFTTGHPVKYFVYSRLEKTTFTSTLQVLRWTSRGRNREREPSAPQRSSTPLDPFPTPPIPSISLRCYDVSWPLKYKKSQNNTVLLPPSCVNPYLLLTEGPRSDWYH